MTDNLIVNGPPEVDIDRLMDEIREEVAERRKKDQGYSQEIQEHSFREKPNFESLPQEGNPMLDISSLRSTLSFAEGHTDVGTQVTPMVHFRRPIRQIAQWIGKIVIYLSSFITVKQREFNVAVIRALDRVIEGLEVLDTQNTLRRNEHIETRSTIGDVNHQQTRMNGTIENLKSTIETLKGQHVQIKELEKTLLQLKTGLLLQENRLSMFLEEARKRLPEPFRREDLHVMADEGKQLLETFYASIEDQFRGTREDIKERLKIYLTFLKEAGLDKEKTPILDLGCGRGEWLELAQEEGLRARGVDHNRVFVKQCRDRGFEVIESDVIQHLRGLPDASLGAVTGFHIIEHLPFEALITLLDETVRVLKPGGIAIFETPNPENILVGSCNFHVDPSHISPIPSSLMKFIAEARGLCKVRILNLHPYPESFKVSGSEFADRFNEYFYGPQDYAVIGVKL